MSFLESTLGKVVTAALALGVVALGIGWWRMEEATQAAILGGVGATLAWLLVVLALPWASFLAVGWVGRQGSNAAGVALVVGLTLAELGLLTWLFGGSFGGGVGWAFAAAGTLLAGVYNLLACDWIAEKVA